MLSEFFHNTQELTLNPIDALRNLREEKLGKAFIYFIALVLVESVLFLIVLNSTISDLTFGMISLGDIVTVNIAYLIVFFIGASIICNIIIMLIISVIQHIFVFIFGGRKGIKQTIKAVIYSYVPIAVIGWVPFVGLISYIWAVILLIFAVRELHEISTARAILAVISLIVFIVITVVAIIAYIILGIYLPSQQ